ncbi:hypothetical protein DZG01_04600 [Pseudomonas fluorescens]|nr:hypothetical protein DZG01_04600 [Pseudomonas fluorescens]
MWGPSRDSVGQRTSMFNDTPLSRAGSLPQGICVIHALVPAEDQSGLTQLHFDPIPPGLLGCINARVSP